MPGPPGLAHEDDDPIVGFDDLFDLDTELLPWLLDLDHVLEHGRRPAHDLAFVEATAGTEPDHFGVEHVRQRGGVLSHDQVQEPLDERHRHEPGAASTSAFSACADAWRSRRTQRFRYGRSSTWSPDTSGR